MSKTKRYLSILLSLVLLCTTVLPMSAFAAENPLQIMCDGVVVSGNADNPLTIKETEQKQLSVTYNGQTELPEGTKVVWSSPTPYLAYVDENGVVTGRDSSKGAILRVWVDTHIASLWLIGPGLADIVYGWFDKYEIDKLDTEGIVNIMEVGLKPILGEATTAGLIESLRNTLNSINVEIRAALVDEATGEEIAAHSTHVVVAKSDSLTAEFIPNGTYITNHDAVPSTVEVGYTMDMEGITTPLRLNMGVNWKVTEKVLGLDVPTTKATIDEDGKVVFHKPGTVKITATPDSEGLYNKLTELIELSGGIANAGATIAKVITEVFGLSVSQSVINALIKVINGIVDAGTSDSAETLKKIVATVSDWILGVTINDSVTVTVVDQLDVESFEIYGKLDGLNSYGGTRQLTITNIQPEGAIVNPEDVVWATNNSDYAVIDETGLLTIRSGGNWGNKIQVTATIDGISRSINGNILGSNTTSPTDLEFSGPDHLEVGETATYDFTVYPLALYDDGALIDYNNVDVGLMVNGTVRYENGVTDGVLRIDKANNVDAPGGKGGTFTVTAVGGGETTLYVRAHTGSVAPINGKITREMKITVHQPVASVTIDQGDAVSVETAVTTGIGSASTQLTATVAPEDATNNAVTWSSDNALVRVDGNGKVSFTGLLYSPVSATITAASVENPEITDSCVVTFRKARTGVTGVTLDRTELALKEGASAQLAATVTPSNANNKAVIWDSSDSSVVTVSDGLVTAVAPGDAMITVTTEDGGFSAQCQVRVRADMEKLNKLIAVVEADASLTPDQYDEALLAVLQAALKDAKAIAAEELSTQAAVDQAYASLLDSYGALGKSVPLESVAITGGERNGNVIYVKVPWTQPYRKASVDLGIQVTESAEIARVTWAPANWSVDRPEANIEANGDTAKITPNGRGIGARSMWITVTVEDVYGNVQTDTVKVRFYNWNWQK
ncbi:MAG: Ig-like domain-containing protein [Candidatus Fimivicinus sp.]|nr:Ig-like domain-containing protein [Oscillospiraceae bacterium]MDY5591851.1 Ig-like domain-containing protein [Candidatus Fimivicinus sp.]